MGSQGVTQAVVVTNSTSAPIRPNQTLEQMALFTEAGVAINLPAKGSDVLLTGYSAQTAGALSATDTVNKALAKLEARIAELESA